MKKFRSMAALTTVCGFLASCGGSGSSFVSDGTGTGTGGTGGGTTTPTYSLGSGSGSTFQSGAIEVGVANLAAGGTTGLQVSIIDQTGTLYSSATPQTITFNSPCVAAGQATITGTGTSAGTAPGTVTTSSGIASATYVAKGCSGPDVITATTAVGSTNLQATGTVTVAASAIGSIQFQSATPATIGLKGTGLGETSTVIFKVVDSSGGPRPGVPVTFALNTTVGGLSISPTSATSAADGTVQTVVSSGTSHTSVRVTASITSPNLSTQSSVLAVTTGIPASSAFSIAVGDSNTCYNVEAYNHDGVTVPITVRLADRYNNPAPDGTSVAFTTNGGHIVGNCSTPTAAGDGTCSVNWVSANPRPTTSDTIPTVRNGRVSILATAIGEESFTDANGNGYYDSNETFANLGEPYRDDNESHQYDVGEYFLDFNHDSTRNAGDGVFKGITCTGSTAGSTCSTSTLAIGVSAMIIMSTDAAAITITGVSPSSANAGSSTNPALSIAVGASVSISYHVSDLNGNTMAAGSTIAPSLDSAAGTVTQVPANPYKVPCSTGGGQDLSLTVTGGATPGNGNLIITATSNPGGLATAFVIPVSVH